MLFQFVVWRFFWKWNSIQIWDVDVSTCFGHEWFVTLTSRIFYILETVSGTCKRCLGVKFLIVPPFGHILGCARIRCTLMEDPEGSKFQIHRFMHVCAISSALESQSKPQIANLYYCIYSCFVVRLQQSFEVWSFKRVGRIKHNHTFKLNWDCDSPVELKKTDLQKRFFCQSYVPNFLLRPLFCRIWDPSPKPRDCDGYIADNILPHFQQLGC